jgi:hypothetical protein
MREQGVGWPETEEEQQRLEHMRMGSSDLSKPADTPVVHVCVQGGHESIRTMLNSVNEALPVLLVRGTGKATDLVADCVCFKFPMGHPKHLDRHHLTHRQKVLFTLLEELRAQAGKLLPTLDFYKNMDFYKMDQLHPWKTKGRSVNPPIDDPSGQGYSAILQLLKHSVDLPGPAQMEIEQRSQQVLGAYDVPPTPGGEEARKVLIHVILTAKTKFAWVYDLETGRGGAKLVDHNRVEQGLDKATDFTGAVLHCLINGIDQAPGGQRDKLGLAMTLAIKWDRPDVLHWLLRRNASRTQRFAFQALIDQFLQMAVHARNEKAVVKLLEYGASLSAYKFTAGADEMEEDIGGVHQTPTRTARKMKAEAQLQRAAQLWEKLIRHCKSDPPTRHVYVFLGLTKQRFRARASLRGGFGGLRSSSQAPPADDYWQSLNDMDLSMLVGWEAYAGLDWRGMMQRMPPQERASLSHEDQVEIKCRCHTWQRLVLLQSFYKHLLGKGFRYYYGILDSPNFDLFLWFVLCHRPDMAMIFWQNCKEPMFTAILAAYICRKMAGHHTITHSSSADEMRVTADSFEALAIKVCQAAFNDDRHMVGRTGSRV